MNYRYKTSVMIFRRDLRLDDNTALNACARDSLVVIPLFIIDPRQVGAVNRYKSEHALCFMLQSLNGLARTLHKKGGRLHVLSGVAEQVVRRLLKHNAIDALYFNRDYTPFARKRDHALEHLCTQYHVTCHICDDILLTNPDTIKTDQGKVYTQFTAFYKKASTFAVLQPQPLSSRIGWYTTPLKKVSYYEHSFVCPDSQRNIFGGARHARKILKKIGQFSDYSRTRNFPAFPTTRLSAHNKFGTISIRRVYYVLRKQLGKSSLIQQLYWRDFFTHIAFHTPRVFQGAFKPMPYRWATNKNHWKCWCTGMTGFPLVDAGMRELNATGFMHNRVRMVVASFLIKDLHINWRWGERYFAQHLVDYDPSVNNGNWQWVASTGADSQPYFRIFNPWLQQKKYDSDGRYIKQWLPELADVAVRDIHRWFDVRVRKQYQTHYPVPIVDHAHERNITLHMVKRIRV